MIAGGAAARKVVCDAAAGRGRSLCWVPVAECLFESVDLVELVLEVNAAEEEGHHGVEAEAKRLGAVEVLLQRVAQSEAGDEADDPASETDQVADDAAMRMPVVGQGDDDAPRSRRS